MTYLNLFFRFGIALVIGILIGLQREYAFDEPDKELFAGVRTFAPDGADRLRRSIVIGLYKFSLAINYYIVGNRRIFGHYVFCRGIQGKVWPDDRNFCGLTVLLGALAYWDQVVLAVGSRPLRLSILPGYLLMMATGVAVAFLI